MNTLAQEIIEKFRQLEPDERQWMVSVLQAESNTAPISLKAWLKEAETVRFQPAADANGHIPSVSDLVNEAREERDGDILHSIGLRRSTGNGTT